MASKKASAVKRGVLEGGGGAGGNGTVIDNTFKISKITIAPARKVGLPNYSSYTVATSVEVVFDTPQDINSPEIEKACDAVHELIKTELGKQKAIVYKAKPTEETTKKQ